MGIVTVLLKALAGMGARLLTEKFLARIVIIFLEAWAKRTKADWDDKIVVELKKAMGVE